MSESPSAQRARAARLGTREGEQLDAALRGLEIAEGAAILGPATASPAPSCEHEEELRRVHREYQILLTAHEEKLAELAAQVAFNQAIQRSWAWRALQSARRLVGRTW